MFKHNICKGLLMVICVCVLYVGEVYAQIPASNADRDRIINAIKRFLDPYDPSLPNIPKSPQDLPDCSDTCCPTATGPRVGPFRETKEKVLSGEDNQKNCMEAALNWSLRKIPFKGDDWADDICDKHADMTQDFLESRGQITWRYTKESDWEPVCPPAPCNVPHNGTWEEIREETEYKGVVAPNDIKYISRKWTTDPTCSMTNTTAFFDGPRVNDIGSFFASLFGIIPSLIPEVEAVQTIRFDDLTDAQKQALYDQGWTQPDLTNNPALQGLIDALNGGSGLNGNKIRNSDVIPSDLSDYPITQAVQDLLNQLDENASCPNDPEKETAGVCGCGVPDTDVAGEEVADCIELYYLQTARDQFQELEDQITTTPGLPQSVQNNLNQRINEVRSQISSLEAILPPDTQFPSWAPDGFLPDILYVYQMERRLMTAGEGSRNQIAQTLLEYIDRYHPIIPADDGRRGPEMYGCPEFILDGKYKICNALSTDITANQVFTPNCDDAGMDGCYFACENGSDQIDCEIKTVEPPIYNCPDFILHERYTYCNSKSSAPNSKAMFTGSCEEGITDACYFTCKNGSQNMDCEASAPTSSF